MGVFEEILLIFGRFVRNAIDWLMAVGVGVVFRDGGATPLPPCKDPLLLQPAHLLAEKIRNKELTSEQVVQSYIHRIQQVNPFLNAVVDQRFEDALAEARNIDQIIQNGHKTLEAMETDTPFLGVPMTIKENFQVTGMKQTVGLVARRNNRSVADAEAVRLVRRAGAIILGVTNVPELCSSWETINKVYGRTNNPYNTSRISGGSSGGECSIIGAGGSVMGIGSDIGGSIRLPAMFCGIFGHKPTWGVVSNSGSEPTLNTALDKYLVTGPLCRYASDLRPLYKVLAGSSNETVLQLDEAVDMKKLRVFYLDEDLGEPIMNPVQPQVKNAIKKAVKHLETECGITAHKLDLVKLRSAIGMFLTIYVEESQGTIFNKLKKETGKDMNLMFELVKWATGMSQHTLMPLAVSLIEMAFKSYSHNHYPEVSKRRDDLAEEFQTLLGEDGVLLCPTHPTTAVHHTEPVPQFFNMIYTATFNLLGMPCTHCPLGLSSDGLPLGVQVIAARHQDRLTLSVAEALEKGLGGWVCPGPKSLAHS